MYCGTFLIYVIAYLRQEQIHVQQTMEVAVICAWLDQTPTCVHVQHSPILNHVPQVILNQFCRTQQISCMHLNQVSEISYPWESLQIEVSAWI